MSAPPKIVPGNNAVLQRGQLYRAAIVGAGTLKGKEVAEMLSERNFPAADIRLLDDDESIGRLEATGDEINFIQSLRLEQFTNVDFTFFAADAQTTRDNWKRARDAGSAIIDLSGALENEDGVEVRSLWIERERGNMWQPELQPAPCIVPHPAALTLALLLLRARKAGEIRCAAATVFEPASERGQKGMDELHQQTVNLLSFQTLPKDLFDAQVAFNMVARYGQKSSLSLEALEARVRKQYQELSGAKVPQPALLMLQPPVFHGIAVSLFLEMDSPVNEAKLSEALSGDHVTLAAAEDDDSQPSNVNTAGQPNILVSLKRDVSNPKGVWIWAAVDNLRVAAITAVECAESMIPTRPLGKIQ
jgi:aspartate-semialdehyde dehydrogenase